MQISASDTTEELAQFELLKNSLAHWMDLIGRLQAVAMEEEKIDEIQLTILRASVIEGFVSFDRVRKDSEVPNFAKKPPVYKKLGRYAISRAAGGLEKRLLGTVRPMPSHKKYRRFYISEKGRDCLDRVETTLASSVLFHIGARSENSCRNYRFAHRLWILTRYLPYRRVARCELDMEGLKDSLGRNEPLGPNDRKHQRMLLAAVRLLPQDPENDVCG